MGLEVHTETKSLRTVSYTHLNYNYDKYLDKIKSISKFKNEFNLAEDEVESIALALSKGFELSKVIGAIGVSVITDCSIQDVIDLGQLSYNCLLYTSRCV